MTWGREAEISLHVTLKAGGSESAGSKYMVPDYRCNLEQEKERY